MLFLFFHGWVLSMGLGKIKVASFLNQPLRAEISLFDVGRISLDSIKVSLAPLGEFERRGFERPDILDTFKFEVRNNQQGQPIINIWSNARIAEPYLQIVVDLVSPNGPLYYPCTILLDPPGYPLEIIAIQAGVTTIAADRFSRNEATYGPTLANENIGQIAQRYSTPDTSLQQIILAIVGTNSQAFTQGNLNGLKTGEHLRIPSNDEVLKIPVDLAKSETNAHDLAWNTGQEIKHVLLPPYIEGVTGTSQFDKRRGIGQR